MLETLVAIGQVLGLARTVESLQRLWNKWRQKPAAETMAGRFIRLFEAHGVHRNQIPRFFGHGLQFKDVQDDAALLACLTDKHVADACELFAVERQWLERGEGRVHARHHFYLHPLAFAAFLNELLASPKPVEGTDLRATLYGALQDTQLESTLVVSVPIGLLNDDVIYRYHLVDAGPLGYWKARVSAAALVAQALGCNLWVNGRNCDAKQLEKFTYAEGIWSLQVQDLLIVGSRRMEVDHWLLEPAVFLEGVDPELHRFGILSALDLWLTLEAQGLMKHPHSKFGARLQFEMAFEEQKTV